MRMVMWARSYPRIDSCLEYESDGTQTRLGSLPENEIVLSMDIAAVAVQAVMSGSCQRSALRSNILKRQSPGLAVAVALPVGVGTRPTTLASPEAVVVPGTRVEEVVGMAVAAAVGFVLGDGVGVSLALGDAAVWSATAIWAGAAAADGGDVSGEAGEAAAGDGATFTDSATDAMNRLATASDV